MQPHGKSASQSIQTRSVVQETSMYGQLHLMYEEELSHALSLSRSLALSLSSRSEPMLSLPRLKLTMRCKRQALKFVVHNEVVGVLRKACKAS